MRFFASTLPFVACAFAAAIAEPEHPAGRDVTREELASRDSGFQINYYTDGGCASYLVSVPMVAATTSPTTETTVPISPTAMDPTADARYLRRLTVTVPRRPLSITAAIVPRTSAVASFRWHATTSEADGRRSVSSTESSL